MIIHIINIRKKLVGVLLGCIILVIILILKLTYFNESQISTGAFIHVEKESGYENDLAGFSNDKSYELDERFQRPSKLSAVKLKYNFIRPKDKDEVPPYIAEGFPTIYQSPENVIHGYYAILKNAANMIGYGGGCGTILWNDIPYPYAYRLLSDDMKANITLEEFKDSFKGTGAMNLLHLEPAYQPPNTPDNIKYYFVEVEVLKGHKYKKEGKGFKRQPNYFEYYYGIVTTEYDKKEGWKIKSVDYLPEIYLCHPLHGWDYYYDWIIGVIYNNWYGMNLKIDNTEIVNNYIKVYASNQDNEYKFDFIRLTNGDDVLVHEYIKENDKWKEVSILKPDHEKYYKISILKFNNK
ncbi:hypothetical protein SH2C18_04020 [Clostridium sediminicola]|uniref:hypothetical protein n=1 Tax=Clostridium sediminicola TaxID=3114879 RepID=UPI0031F24E20